MLNSSIIAVMVLSLVVILLLLVCILRKRGPGVEEGGGKLLEGKQKMMNNCIQSDHCKPQLCQEQQILNSRALAF